MDERLTNIEAQKQAQLQKNDALYSGLLSDAQNLYNQQQEYANQYETTQNDILNKQLEYSTNLIEQQKDIARQNARTEQNKAQNEYKAYINPYGKQAESLASQGLATSGVSETAKLGGFNTYQNRLASANKVLQDAITQYDNDINQARLNNDVSKAQNALKKLELQLQYSESYYNKKGEYQLNQFNTGRSIDTDYYNRYQTEYQNIQNEKAQQEAIRQWEAQMAYQKQRDAVADAQWEKKYALSKAKAKSSGTGSYATLTNGPTGSGYTILSTDSNGWGKTNLTQKLSNGGTAEVYENPNGELLYWNPSTNSWAKYGSSNAKTNTANATQYNLSNDKTKYKSTYTPNVSQAARNFISSLGTKSYTLSELSQKLAQAESQGKITTDETNAILRSYGINI